MMLESDLSIDFSPSSLRMFDTAIISSLAAAIDDAQTNAHVIAKLTDSSPDMSINDAYAVQEELCRRWEVRGPQLAGFKAGAASKAKMLQMDVKTYASELVGLHEIGTGCGVAMSVRQFSRTKFDS